MTGSYLVLMEVLSGLINLLPVRKNSCCKGEPEDHGLGRSRGGFSTKIHLVCDGQGLPLVVEISGGQAHESVEFENLMEKIEIRGIPGRPRKYPEKIAGDKAYSAQHIRDWLKIHKIEDIIPTRSSEQRRHDFDKKTYKQRNFIERCIGWLKEARRIATRYEKLALHYTGMLKLAMILEYL